MPYLSLNPASGEVLGRFPSWDPARLDAALEQTALAQRAWGAAPIARRAAPLARAADILRQRRDRLAALITAEMGKPIAEARAEVEKCALACDYYARHAAQFLLDERIASDADSSYVSYLPLGTVLAVMPWNFPFWQVFRFAAPALMAGNAAVLKHASSTPQCALEIEALFLAAGFPARLFTTLMIEAGDVAAAIASPHVQAVTLTGSEGAGRQVAAVAGAHLKKCVLELGGSDAFVVLADADLEWAASQAVASRFLNCGQSCIAAKRIVVVPEIADRFVALLKEKIAAIRVGDPTDETSQLGPMARADLRDELHRQIGDSIRQGAEPMLGCAALPGTGFYYAPSLLDRVTPACRAYHEEMFGPVATVIRARDEEDAIRIANDTRFGLGSSLWSRDTRRAERLSREILAGCCFINGMVKSDPRLPFGGVKDSGFGRELSHHGMHEFVNAKTVWIR